MPQVFLPFGFWEEFEQTVYVPITGVEQRLKGFNWMQLQKGQLNGVKVILIWGELSVTLF